MLSKNWIIGLLMSTVSIIALIFIIKGNINMAVLFMTAMFALTNWFRSMNLKENGFDKEAKWMRSVSILFAISFLAILIIINI
ncbi:MAG: hypothetical protein ACE3JQ_10795 [Paenisporosarcina sp.]